MPEMHRYYFLAILLLLVNCHFCFSWFFGASLDAETESVGEREVVSLENTDTPFEMQTSDEKFLQEGTALTTGLSPLDACHHRVVAELQSTCSDLIEEDLAKLAVQLLNCQSQSEGRKIFPCDSRMTIADCTSEMDPTTWNAYQIVSNRARAICYATQQSQFRLKTEFTVNKLVHTTHGQIMAMRELQASQDQMKEATQDTLENVEESQENLINQQRSLQSTQSNIHSQMSKNMKELTREKALIAAGHHELAELTEGISKRIDTANAKLMRQENQQKDNHDEILRDLATIREKAKQVWEKLDNSSKQVLKFQNETTLHYETTLENLRRVNSTINYLLSTTHDMRSALETKINWLATMLGCTGDRVAVLSTVALHAVYFVIAAVSASFLQTPVFSRLLLLLLVPLNAASEIKQRKSLSFPAMTCFIILTVAGNWTVGFMCYCWKKTIKSKSCKTDEMKRITAPQRRVSSLADDSTLGDREESTPNVSAHEKPKRSPDISRLLSILEKLYQTGALTPAVTRRPLSQSEPPKSDDPRLCLANPPPTPDIPKPQKHLYQDSPPPTPVSHQEPVWGQDSLLDSSIDSVCTDIMADTPKIDLVKRHLMQTLDTGSHSPKRTSRRRSSTTSTPVKQSPRSSRASTPSRSFMRPLCLATTKAGLPCKLPSMEASAFCYKHQAST